MIHTSHAKTINAMDEIIKELEEAYKFFELKTIVPISGGYVLYYTINKQGVKK